MVYYEHPVFENEIDCTIRPIEKLPHNATFLKTEAVGDFVSFTIKSDGKQHFYAIWAEIQITQISEQTHSWIMTSGHLLPVVAGL